MKQNDHGIFLHRTSFSESSVIATFYTKSGGLQKYVFQGAKKKNHTLFPLNVCEFTYYGRPDSELKKITQADSTVVLDSILMNPLKSIVAFFIADVIRQTLNTTEKEEPLFQFLVQSIETLNRTNDVANFPLIFLVKFTPWIGIQPHAIDEQILYFNLKEGEFHADYRPGEWSVEGELAVSLFELFELNKLNANFKKQMFDVVLNYYELHIPRFDVSRSLTILKETLM